MRPMSPSGYVYEKLSDIFLIVLQIQAKATIGREWSYTNRSAGPLAIRGTSQAAESEDRKSRDRDSTPLVNGAAVNGAHPASRRCESLSFNRSFNCFLIAIHSSCP